jgi:hypothetical protein
MCISLSLDKVIQDYCTKRYKVGTYHDHVILIASENQWHGFLEL